MSKAVKSWEFKAHAAAGFASVIETDTELTLGMLRVRESQRMKGVGGRLLQRVCDYADSCGKPIYLYAVALGHGTTTLPLGLLIKFYERRGFIPRDDLDYCKMIRYPVNKEPAK